MKSVNVITIEFTTSPAEDAQNEIEVCTFRVPGCIEVNSKNLKNYILYCLEQDGIYKIIDFKIIERIEVLNG